MNGVRVLVGTKKGAFILTSDGKRQKWDVSGPHFGGWEMYHLKASPADPNRIYASQSTGWSASAATSRPRSRKPAPQLAHSRSGTACSFCSSR